MTLLGMSIAEAIVALLLLGSGVVVFIAGLGLVRMPDFFQRMHAPALAYTLASWSVTLASIVHFSMRDTALSLHVWLVIVLLAITTPVTTLLLARAALFRRREAGEPMPPPLLEQGATAPETREAAPRPKN
jgi:multicomponent K+:H+ antiporter subunit G